MYSLMDNLARLSNAQSRSISPENFTGEKGKGGMATSGTGIPGPAEHLGQGWKVSPSIFIEPFSTVTLAEMEGPGVIQHMWMTVAPQYWRSLVFRIYWDNESTPSVEVPLGDFYANGWCVRSNVNSLPIAVNPAGGFNSYWQMPFRKKAKITLESLTKDKIMGFYYSIDYALTEVPDEVGYFHAQWRRSNPVQYKQVHTIIDEVQGQGHYVGTYIAWGVNNNNWWGEGEVKFYIDGDADFPTICGTGTEDYFGGAWNWEHPQGEYGVYSTPFLGLPQVIKPDGLYRAQQRFGMYRWHILDTIRFQQDFRVTVQALGWRSEGRFLPLQDDIASTAFWYQREPHAPFPQLPERDYLEVI
jgi:hypothetical protein